MTEQQWLISTEPQKMYAFIQDRVTERQQRFFVEACRANAAKPWPFWMDCIRWGELAEEWCSRKVFNGDISASDVCDLLREIIGNPFMVSDNLKAAMADGVVGVDADYPVVLFDPRSNPVGWSSYDWDELDFNNARHVASMKWIRRRAKEWLTWNNGTVTNLARAITEERCEVCCGTGAIFLGINVDGTEDWGTCQLCTKGKGYVPRAEPQWDMMAIIADALEEAGCTEAAILDHCRSGGPHVRGCWVLELLSQRNN